MDYILKFYEQIEDNKFLNAEKLKECAKRLMGDYSIVKGDYYYQIGEIEFYYYSPNHKDIITYPRQCSQGLWFFHPSGVDITIQSSVSGMNPSFGGILIRSIIKYNKEGKLVKTICGPQKSVFELFDYLNAVDNSIERTPMIMKHSFPKCNIDLPTQRYIPFDVRSTEVNPDANYQRVIEEKVNDKFNAIIKDNEKYKKDFYIEDPEEWLITNRTQNIIDFKLYLTAPYRFYIKGIDWTNGYKARPQNIAMNGNKFLFTNL